MNKIQEIYNRYFSIKYPTSTGSQEWWSIKTDFELLDNDIMGFISVLTSKKLEDQDLISHISYSDRSIESIEFKLEAYVPVDKIEESEKNLVLERLKLLREIYAISITEYGAK